MKDPFGSSRKIGTALTAIIVLRLAMTALTFVLRFVLPARAVFSVISGVRPIIQLITLVTVIVHIVWVRALFVDLRAAGHTTKHSPSFTVAGWFIPFGNLALPFLSVKQAFDAQRKPWAMALGWWISYVLMVIVQAAQVHGQAFYLLTTVATFGFWLAMVRVMSAPAAIAGPGMPAIGMQPAAPPAGTVQFPREWGWVKLHMRAAGVKSLGYYYRDKAAGPSVKMVVDLLTTPPEQIAQAARTAGYAGNSTFRLPGFESLHVDNMPEEVLAMHRESFEKGHGAAGPQTAVVLYLTENERAQLGLPIAPPHMELYL